MTRFDETKHPRRDDGKFALKRHREPGEMDLPGDGASREQAAEADRRADLLMRQALADARDAGAEIVHHDRKARIRALTSQLWPDAVALLTDVDGYGQPWPRGYRDTNGTEHEFGYDMDNDTADAVADIGFETRELGLTWGLGEEFNQNSHGYGEFDLDRMPAAEMDPRVVFANFQEQLARARAEADGVDLAVRVRGRHPDIDQVHVFTRYDDYDDVDVDSVVFRDGRTAAVSNLDHETARIIRDRFHEHSEGRAWASWCRDGAVDDDGFDPKPSIVFLDDLMPGRGRSTAGQR